MRYDGRVLVYYECHHSPVKWYFLLYEINSEDALNAALEKWLEDMARNFIGGIILHWYHC